jgi:predicted AAA+ superfamily ATPase
MKRLIEKNLLDWKLSKGRKPLLLRGARQVGKTYVVRQFGTHFKSFAEINFELLNDAKDIFKEDLKPDRIIGDLSLLLGEKINPGETLLFLDEIQEAPEAIKALRYFYELMPELHVIAAGSLLEFQIEKIGIPVGRVSFINMYPLNFFEFLMAHQKDEYIDVISDIFKKNRINKAIHNHITRLFGEYIVIGGMPEAVNCWIEAKDYRECRRIHGNLIENYRQDFLKYSKKHQIKYIDRLFDEIPGMLGRKFKYTAISGEYRKRELGPALDLLQKAGVIHKIYHTSGQGLPLGAGINYNRFKVIFLDIALAQVVLNIDSTSWILKPLEQIINKGSIAEAFTGQELIAASDVFIKPQLYYWHREARSSNAEVDYLIQDDDLIIPVEVKSGKEGSMRSMKMFLKEHPKSLYGIRLYGGMPGCAENILSYPLYCAAGLLK